MKVLITTDWYLPAINGVVTSVVNLREQLEKLGFDVRILTLSNDRACHRDGNVYYLPSVDLSRVYPGARGHLHSGMQIIRELISWHPDIVHSQCEFSTFLAARKIARVCGIPQVHTYHTMYEDFVHYISPSILLGKQGAKVMTKGICRKVQHIIVPSEKTKNLLEKYRVKTPVTCIPTGIQVERFEKPAGKERREKLRDLYGIRKEDVVLACVGRLAVEKNLDEVLGLFSHWSLPQNRLLFVGDGPYREELESMVKALGLTQKVIFTGMVPQEEIPDYYQMGDIFVGASKSETQGLTYFEAMAAGLPLLCLHDPCLDRVLLPGQNGFAFQNETEFRSLLRLLTGSSDLRRELGRRGIELVQSRYSAEAFGRAVAGVYQEVLASWHPQGRRSIYGAPQPVI